MLFDPKTLFTAAILIMNALTYVYYVKMFRKSEASSAPAPAPAPTALGSGDSSNVPYAQFT